MDTPHGRMVISRWWAQIAILTFLAGFTVLGLMARSVYTQQPPVPQRVVGDSGQELFTDRDILAGQHVFRKYGLMQHGTVFGHGAYLGPDFTAEHLHKAGEPMPAFYSSGQPAIDVRRGLLLNLAMLRCDGSGASWYRGVTHLPPTGRTATRLIATHHSGSGLKSPAVQSFRG